MLCTCAVLYLPCPQTSHKCKQIEEYWYSTTYVDNEVKSWSFLSIKKDMMPIFHQILRLTACPVSSLINTEKLVKCVLLQSIGRVSSSSCIIPSLDHPPLVWLNTGLSTYHSNRQLLTLFVPIQNPKICTESWQFYWNSCPIEIKFIMQQVLQ